MTRNMHEGRICPLGSEFRLRVPRRATGDGGTGARRVRIASSRYCGSGHWNGQDAGVPDSRDLQRQARSDFYRDKITARATLPKGHSVFTKTLCAKIESGGDERAVEFSVHFETEPGARSGAAQGNRGSGLFSPDQGLGEADGK